MSKGETKEKGRLGEKVASRPPRGSLQLNQGARKQIETRALFDGNKKKGADEEEGGRKYKCERKGKRDSDSPKASLGRKQGFVAAWCKTSVDYGTGRTALETIPG